MAKTSNFALMDEMEAQENLQSEDAMSDRAFPWEYSGKTYWMLRKLRLTPALATGIIMILAGFVLMQTQLGILGLKMLGLGIFMTMYGVLEKLMIDWKEKD